MAVVSSLLLLALLMPLLNTYAGEPVLVDPWKLTFDTVKFVPREADRVVIENGMVATLP
jgi:hypothetical protein